MRILVVSDIHANSFALSAVRESFDICVCLGDTVEYGTESAHCLAWVRANCTHTVRGNHDHGAAQNVEVIGVNGFRYLTMVSRKYTIGQLTPRDRKQLADYPTTVLTTIGGKRFMLVHASPRDPMEEYVPGDPELWRQQLQGLDLDYLLVGHTHQQFLLNIGKTKVVNPGAVGLQRDGDPRARYAVIQDDSVELKQTEYDVDGMIDSLNRSDLDPIGKRVLADVYRRGKYIHPPELPYRTAPNHSRTSHHHLDDDTLRRLSKAPAV